MDRKLGQFFGSSNLLILEGDGTISVRESDDRKHVAYGLPVTSFSLSIDRRLLAILTRGNRRTLSELHVFRFESGDVGELLGKATFDGVFQSILWSPDNQFLVVTGHNGCAIFRTSPQVSLVCMDGGSQCCFAGNLFAELNGRSQVLSLWNLPSNSQVGELSLHRRALPVLDICGVSKTIFSLYSDYSLTVTLVLDEGGKCDKLQKIEGLFPTEEGNKRVEELSPKLMSFALGKFLVVGLRNSLYVHIFSENMETVEHVGTCRLPRDAMLLDAAFDGAELLSAAYVFISSNRIEVSSTVMGPPKFDKSSVGRKKKDVGSSETPSLPQQKSEPTSTAVAERIEVEKRISQKPTTPRQTRGSSRPSPVIVAAIGVVASAAIFFYLKKKK